MLNSPRLSENITSIKDSTFHCCFVWSPHLKVSLQTLDTRIDVGRGFPQSMKFTVGIAPLHITTSVLSFPFLQSGSPCAFIAMVDQCFRLGGAASESQARSHFFSPLIWVFLFPAEQVSRMLLHIMFPSVLFAIRNGHRRCIPTVTGNSRRNSI